MRVQPIRVGIFAYEPHVNKCVLNSTTLLPTSYCARPGLYAQVLGMAFQLANIPYELVETEFRGDFGSLDEQTGTWSGKQAHTVHIRMKSR